MSFKTHGGLTLVLPPMLLNRFTCQRTPNEDKINVFIENSAKIEVEFTDTFRFKLDLIDTLNVPPRTRNLVVF